MGIFTRLSDIVNSNINAMLDRAEDPEKIIRLMIQEMEDTLVEVRTSAARIIADKKGMRRTLDGSGDMQASWQRKAELAISKGRDDLAKGALVEKAKIAEAAAAVAQELSSLDDELGRHEEDIVKLEAKLNEARAKQKTLLARHEVASNRVKVRQQISMPQLDDAFSRFEQMERRIDRKDAEVEAYSLGGKKSLADEIADLETDDAVEAELAALKAQIGGFGDDADDAAPKKAPAKKAPAKK